MRRRILAVAAAGFLLIGAPAAHGQEATEEEALAGYVGMASGAAFSIQPIFPGLLPTGEAPFEVTAALSNANVKSGGIANGQAAAVWPGSAAANMGPLIDQGAGQTMFSQLIPPYPAGVTANQDQGAASQGVSPGPVMTATAKAGEAVGKVAATSGGLTGVVEVDTVASTSRSLIEGGKLVSQAVITLQGISLGAGQVTIDSIKTVAKTTSDGNASTSEGDTVVNGAKVGDSPAEVTEEGIKATGPAAAGANQALKAAGITVRLAEGSGSNQGGAADRVQSGVVVEIANPAAAANPQFEGSRFVISLAPAAAGALASPPFSADFTDALPELPSIESGGGFSQFSNAVEGLFGAGGIGVGGGGGSGRAAAAGVPLDTERTGNVIEDVKGVTVGLAAAGLFAVVLGTRWLRRYVGRFMGVEG